ncbi:anthranilate synthase component I [Nitrococcus mobilis Nb-231]|uniref:Anthranilate synthase component I n=1 Tax=Nitrococcus mobilis Nb-231 TaxID=314278 RepID=A4BUV6_9GAMM|nr:anthranilate synthase component I [Nitrococcus mobilis Nb-231]
MVDLLDLHAYCPERYPHLLESAAFGTAQGRYDILFAFPGETLELGASGQLSGSVNASAGGFLTNLDAWWAQSTRSLGSPEACPLPFTGGWFLFLGYELAAEIEPVLRLPKDSALPIAVATRIPAAVIRDHEQNRTWLVAESEYIDRLERIEADIRALAARRPPPRYSSVLAGALAEEPGSRYLDAVHRIERYIRDGDVFQVNLSRRWSGRLQPNTTSSELYRRLRRANPGPFSGLATWGDRAVISSSPERLVRVRDQTVETRPIAGTRPRHSDPNRDQDSRRVLLAHPKERAEHIMLIDLERNDLGRICEPGSIVVDELMSLESYAHVHHIVSNVRGRLVETVSPGEVIRAVFPGGTITGCPKVRCMEILAELEQAARGAYTGSMGYLNRDGSMDLNILIRTMQRCGETLSFRAGGGIVVDSVPHRELAETRAKARGLILALEPAADLGSDE